MIIEPVLDKPICLKKEDVLPRVVNEDFERKSEFIFSKPKTKSNVKLNLYFTTTIIFLLGIIIGSIIFRIMVEDIQVQQLVIEKFSTIENTTEKILFQKSFERNIKLLVVYWIVGISVVGAPLLLLLCMYKGFSTAFVISSFLLKYGFVEGNIFIFKNLFLYYLFLILGVILFWYLGVLAFIVTGFLDCMVISVLIWFCIFYNMKTLFEDKFSDCIDTN